MYITIIAISVIIIAIIFPNNQTAEASVVEDFKDVPKTHPNYEIIMEMVDKGYISGYEDGTFRPNDIITRKHAAVLIDNAVELERASYETYKQPIDLPEDYVYYEQMMNMVKAELMRANNAGYIFPDRELTRGEMAQIIAKGFKLDLKVDMHPFTDVADWSNQYVSALYKAGVTSGYEDGTFRESEKLTREHFAIFMFRAMEHLKPVDIDSLTDEEIYDLTNVQLATLLPMFHYDYEYLPEGQTDSRENYDRHWRTQSAYTRYFDRYDEVGFKFPMAKKHLDKQRYGSIGDTLRELSEDVFGLSAKETIEMLNGVFLDGNLVQGKDVPSPVRDFSVYFNYSSGYLVLTIDSKVIRK